MTMPELAVWRVEALRITVFGVEPLAAAGQNWWRTVTGQEPETAINRPQSGEYSEIGPFLGGQLELKVAFNRADWILSYPLIGLPGAPEPSGTLVSTLREFAFSVSKWTAEKPVAASRVALGSVGYVQVENIKAGNEIVGLYIPYMDLTKVSDLTDLLIQLNTPYESKLLGSARINNVTKWAVLGRQVFAIGPTGMPQIKNDIAVRSEFDLSTATDGASVDLSSFGALSSEMIDAVEGVLSAGLKL
ncbi:hypothetical protein [Pseudomonas laurentiana]